MNQKHIKEKNIEELKWIEKAKLGDMESFEKLIVSHEKMVYNVAYRMMNNQEDALDLSQEVFIKAFRKMKDFNEKSSFSTWIYRITVNACIDEMRKRKGKQNFSIDQVLEGENGNYEQQFVSKEETPEETILKQEKQSEILNALNTLSEEHKTVIILRELQGLSYEEIAETVGMTLGTVKSRISRARIHLKTEILKIWERNKH